MIISYTTTRIPDKEMIASCDKGARGFQELIIETTKILSGWKLAAVIWLLSRFYKRTVTDSRIEYDFYLLKGKTL